MKPVCVTCACVMTVKKNGVNVITYDGEGRPYTIQDGDLFDCPVCHAKVVAEFGTRPWIIAGVGNQDIVEVIGKLKERCPDRIVEVRS